MLITPRNLFYFWEKLPRFFKRFFLKPYCQSGKIKKKHFPSQKKRCKRISEICTNYVELRLFSLIAASFYPFYRLQITHALLQTQKKGQFNFFHSFIFCGGRREKKIRNELKMVSRVVKYERQQKNTVKTTTKKVKEDQGKERKKDFTWPNPKRN